MVDTVLRNEGTKILINALGLQNATRFFTIIQQEPFDYTKWQENLFEDLSIEKISQNAALYRKNKE
jgi:membrane-anchored protein YejM (alkaline phosphatase superfamily)